MGNKPVQPAPRWRLRDPADLKAARAAATRPDGSAGHSHRSLAAIVGCTHSLISHLEAGRTTVLTGARARDLCAALGVDLDDLFDKVAP